MKKGLRDRFAIALFVAVVVGACTMSKEAALVVFLIVAIAFPS